MVHSLSFVLFASIVGSNLSNADITWPLYNQQCRDDAGSPYVDDEAEYNGGKYHDGSAAYPVLQEDGTCAKPMQAACNSRPSPKTAYLEGPIDCGDNGWYCRIYNDESNGWANINLNGDVNFGNCNSTDSFEDAGYDQDGHCHGSDSDSTYYWWIRDHWFRQYNGRVRCCCGWTEGGSQPLYGRRVANRCDFRRLVTPTENLDNCRDANEDHNMGFDDIGCDPQFQASQLNKPIPEDDNVCWEIQRFGYTEGGGSVPTKAPSQTSQPKAPTSSPVVSPATSPPTKAPTASPVVSPVTSPPTPFPVEPPISPPPSSDGDGDDEFSECVDSPLIMIVGGKPRSCEWVERNTDKRCAKRGVAAHCPATCEMCEDFGCADSGRKFRIEGVQSNIKCRFFSGNLDRCSREGAMETCKDTCGYCD